MVGTACSFYEKPQKVVDFDYYIYLPKGYEQESHEKWPLIMYLHGAGEKGNGMEDLPLVKTIGLPKYLEDKGDFPFIVVCPQCHKNTFWTVQVENLNFFLDHIIERFNVDEDRVYLTGLSMGGYGTWYLAMAHPERFAAIAPICGGGMPWNASSLKNMGVWVFHGEKDEVVSFRESQDMVNALEKCGADVKFTSFPEIGHDAWPFVYSNEELYKWFLEHRR